MAERIEGARFTKYQTTELLGSTVAIHVLTIAGESYSFLAPSRNQWVFKNDTVSFDWNFYGEKRQRRVVPESVVVLDRTGVAVVRGLRFRDQKPVR
jgi:hypothetical protein